MQANDVAAVAAAAAAAYIKDAKQACSGARTDPMCGFFGAPLTSPWTAGGTQDTGAGPSAAEGPAQLALESAPFLSGGGAGIASSPPATQLEAAVAAAQVGELGVGIDEAMERAVALLRSSGLPPRPTHIENPAREFLFLEQRSVRRYSRNKARPIDSWQHHGGTSRVKMQLPARLQQGESPQVLVRRLGKVVRHDQPELRFHQYEIDDEKVLYHIIGERKRGRPPLVADASRKRIARWPTEPPVRLRLVPATIPAQAGSAGPVAPAVAPAPAPGGPNGGAKEACQLLSDQRKWADVSWAELCAQSSSSGSTSNEGVQLLLPPAPSGAAAAAARGPDSPLPTASASCPGEEEPGEPSHFPADEATSLRRHQQHPPKQLSEAQRSPVLVDAGAVLGQPAAEDPERWRVTAQHKKLFATLFSTCAIVAILGAEAEPMVAEHGTRQLSEAQLLGLLYSDPGDERLVVSGWEHWRCGGLGQVNFGHPCRLLYIMSVPWLSYSYLLPLGLWFQRRVVEDALGWELSASTRHNGDGHGGSLSRLLSRRGDAAPVLWSKACLDAGVSGALQIGFILFFCDKMLLLLLVRFIVDIWRPRRKRHGEITLASVRAFWMVSAIRVGAVAVSLELSAGLFGLWQAHVPAVPLASLGIGDSLPEALGAVDVGFAALAAAGCCAASWPLLLAGVLIQLVLCCADAARAMVAWGPGWALPEATGLQAPMILVALLSMLHNPLARRLVARWRPGSREAQEGL